MTGPEHYREAEALVQEAAEARDRSGDGLNAEDINRYLKAAQVHATLALAAATAYDKHAPKGGPA